MDKKLEEFIFDTMIKVSAGTELIRKFSDKNKWISSNYRMSIPSNGSNQSHSEKIVKISSFYMSKFPVSNQLYKKVVGLQDSKNSNDLIPKVNISWIDAIKFCNMISVQFGLNPCYSFDESDSEVTYNNEANGFRLPTDSEWQYACRADSDAYQYSDIETIAWHLGNSNHRIQKVGMKKPNSWGLYDMLGNVWEWCWDLYNPETYDSYRIFRGGSFAEESRICGATTRRKSLPTFAIDDLGFRLVKDI